MTQDVKAQHTPGPWEAIRGSEEGDELRCAVVAKRGKLAYLVATIENGAPGDICDTEWANARIMAASIDLLEALEAIDDLLSSELEERKPTKGSVIEALLRLPRDVARAAIARATGEQP